MEALKQQIFFEEKKISDNFEGIDN